MNPLSTSTASNSVLKRVAAGEHGATEECIRTYSNLVWALARRFNNRPEDAEDATQDIFLAVWENAARYDASKASEATFIATIARRRLMDRLRTSYRRPRTEPILDTHRATSADALRLENKIEASKVVRLMKNLRPEQIEMIWLNFYGGMSHREIADAKQLPLGTVKTHLKRGIDRVREMIVQDRFEQGSHATTC